MRGKSESAGIYQNVNESQKAYIPNEKEETETGVVGIYSGLESTLEEMSDGAINAQLDPLIAVAEEAKLE